MDNRLKRDLVKFFKKMNKNNLALLKEDKSLIKDLEDIDDDELLIQEGLKQCEFILAYFTGEETAQDNKKDKSSSHKRDSQEKKEKKEKEEREKREREEREERERKEREKKEKEKKEKEKREKEEKERKEKEKKEKEKKEKEKKEKEKKEKEKKEKEKKEKEKKEKKEENEEREEEEEFEEEEVELNDTKKLKEKEKTKENSSTEPQSDSLKRTSSRKVPTLKRPPTLSQLTDEQTGQTEHAVYEIGDGITIKVEWKYLRDKTYQPAEDEEDPEKHEKVDLIFRTNYQDDLILHWGVYRAFHDTEWLHPIKECYPDYSKEFDKKAIQTEFKEDESENEPSIRIMIPRGKGFENVIGGINFVIFDPVKNKWYNNYRKDFQIKFKLKVNKLKSRMILVDRNLTAPEFVGEIIKCEATYGSWTLMHRYHKCSDIINNWDENTPNEYWSWIVIWLRYSYQRQLDWQRNYNTRPRELSGAMDRLSMLVTNKYSNSISKEKPYRSLFNSQASLIKYSLSFVMRF